MSEFDDLEEILRTFQPVGPPANLRSRVLLGQPAPASRISSPRWVLIASGLAALVGVSVFVAMQKGPKGGSTAVGRESLAVSLTPEQRTAFEREWSIQPHVDLGVPSDGAAVVMVEFADWLCPPCEGLHASNRKLFGEYERNTPGAMKYVVKDWPLNSACNASVKITPRGHEASCAAAAAVRTARNYGKGEEVIDWIFANRLRITSLQPTMASETLRAGAAAILGGVAVDANDSAQLDRLRADTSPGPAVRPEGTPEVYINGRRVPDLQAAYIDLAIQIELRKANAGPR